jgi:hypothetical protein
MGGRNQSESVAGMRRNTQVGMANPVIASIAPIKNAEEGLPVQVVLKHGLLFIPPGGNVIDSPRVFDTKGTRHDRTLSYHNKECKLNRPDPNASRT